MPLEMLRELATQVLPVRITDPEQLEKLRRLREGGDIIVLLPIGYEVEPHATVLLITAHGWRRLRGHQCPPA
jgi:hypothetical protein